MTDQAFSTLPLSPACLANLAQLEYRVMTPIQELSLPAMLAGRDVLGQAGTGTGKTCAFGLALLARTTPRGHLPGALVLCPTRELAAQVADEIRRLARSLPHTRVITLSGGSSIQRERAALEHGVDVVVGTPGRVQDHVARNRLDLGGIRTLVLDEADRMLEMGFVDAVTTIAAATATDRQTLLFSATFPDAVRELGKAFQRDALHVLAPRDDAAGQVSHEVYDIGSTQRWIAVSRVLGSHRPESAVVFCNRRETCDEVADALTAAGFAAVALHGGMEQHDRNTVLLMLRNGSLRVVVSTDVAARGLDIEQLGAVVNYDLPDDDDVFVHRVGRTARAGHAGLAITLVGPADHGRLAALRAGPLGHAPVIPLAGLSAPAAAAATPAPPTMITIAIQGGRRDRLRPGDLLGALTTGVGLAGSEIGKIEIRDQISFVAVTASVAARALEGLHAGRIKNKRFRAYQVKAPRG